MEDSHNLETAVCWKLNMAAYTCDPSRGRKITTSLKVWRATESMPWWCIPLTPALGEGREGEGRTETGRSLEVKASQNYIELCRNILSQKQGQIKTGQVMVVNASNPSILETNRWSKPGLQVFWPAEDIKGNLVPKQNGNSWSRREAQWWDHLLLFQGIPQPPKAPNTWHA